MEFSKIDKLPTKPAGRKSEASEYQSLIRELMESGEARKSPAISDIPTPGPDGKDLPSDAEKLQRELRRAGRQVGAKVFIRKSGQNASGMVFISFKAEPNPDAVPNGESPEDVDAPPEDTVSRKGPRRVAG